VRDVGANDSPELMGSKEAWILGYPRRTTVRCGEDVATRVDCSNEVTGADARTTDPVVIVSVIGALTLDERNPVRARVGGFDNHIRGLRAQRIVELISDGIASIGGGAANIIQAVIGEWRGLSTPARTEVVSGQYRLT
jgi:hypothetical protein